MSPQNNLTEKDVERIASQILLKQLQSKYLTSRGTRPNIINTEGTVGGEVLTVDADGYAAWSSANNIVAKAGSFAVPAGTGNYSVTGLGFTPALVQFAGNRGSSSSIASIGVGAMDANGNQWTTTLASNEIPTSETVGLSTFCIALTDTAGSTVIQAYYVSMDADGFTINFSAVASGNIYWTAFSQPVSLDTADHGSLTGLGDDDHAQYLLVAGTRAMTGDLNMGGNDINNVATVDGVDVSALSTTVTDHIADTTDAHDASAISNVAAGNIVATDVQAAINELDTEKLALTGGTLTGGLVIDESAGNSELTLDANGTNEANIIWTDDGAAGFKLEFDATSSTLTLYRDATIVWQVNESTGVVDFNETPTKDGGAIALSADVLPLTGGTLTGGLVIDESSGNSELTLDANGTNEANVIWTDDGAAGFKLEFDATSGTLTLYRDATIVWQANETTGTVDFNERPTWDGNDLALLSEAASGGVPITGGTMTGGLVIDESAGDSEITLDANGANEARVNFTDDGVAGFSLSFDATAGVLNLERNATVVFAANESTGVVDFNELPTHDAVSLMSHAIADAKGDILGATAADAFARLAVGSNGQVLTALSSASTGLAWATVPKIKVGTYTTASATGSASVTGVGFTPKLLLVFGGADTATNAVGTICVGGTDGTSHGCMSIGAGDGTGNSSRNRSTTAFFIVISGAGTVLKSFTFTSFDSDGFTFNRGTNDGTAYGMTWVAIG